MKWIDNDKDYYKEQPLTDPESDYCITFFADFSSVNRLVYDPG